MNNNGQEQEDGNEEKWYKKISVEPTMFLYMFAFMLTSVVEQAFYLNKACVTNHGYSQEICDNLNQNDTIKAEVQVSDIFIMMELYLGIKLDDTMVDLVMRAGTCLV